MNMLLDVAPDHWAKAQLSELCELIPGAVTSESPNGSVPVVKPRNLASGKITGRTDLMEAAEAAGRPRYRIKSGDLLCTRTGTIGKTGLAEAAEEGWIFGSGIICIRLRRAAGIAPEFLSAYFMHPAVSDWISRQSRGTSIPHISAKVLGALPVSVPPLDVQQSIAHAIGTLNDSIEAHQRICETTAEIRDTVLPLLMSGELSPDALE